MKAKELNGYYYCFSFSDCSYDLYSIAECHEKKQYSMQLTMGYVCIWPSIERAYSRERKRGFLLQNMHRRTNDRDICRKGETRQYEDYRGIT